MIRQKNGFTLVEISIVMVIIGLLIGGILVGQNMIFASQVQQQVKQLQEYSQAYTMFQSKYNCTPGDCYNATTFFSSTTNGNGNGILESSKVRADGRLDYDNDSNNFDFEFRTFFTHLILAGFIPNEPQIRTLGYPEPKLPHTPRQGFTANSAMFADAASYAGSYTMQSDDYFGLNKWRVGLYFSVGRPSVGWGFNNDRDGLFTPAATYAVDAKIDDGKPQTGDFKGGTIQWTNTGGYTDGYCLSPTPPSLPVAAGLGTEYNISNTKTPCVFAWKLE
jgi:prepilin-type N-terminal cleavage/methylation domain-containing protein